MEPRTNSLRGGWGRKTRSALRELVVMTLCINMAIPAWAQPAGNVQVNQVVQGQAQFTQDGSHTTIHAADNTIINYNQFNVPSDAVVQFVQPSAQSRVLNRVLGSDPSNIQGSLLANGIVYLVNPSGVIFGPGAVVDAAQFHAAAGNISNQDFLNNINHFITDHGTVMNEGAIRTIDGANLLGHKVVNTGTIVAQRGIVTLTSGKDVYLSESGSSVMVRVDHVDAATGHSGHRPADVPQESGLVNEGTVEADEVMFASGDVYSLALINRGTVRSPGGDVTLSGNGLVLNEGTIDVSDRRAGETGGTVKMLGEHVGLVGGTIDASGDAGGGEVLIGGEYMGEGSLRNASGTFLGADSAIHADAITTGDGGRVIVWADQATRAHGVITARGGRDSGNGGFVETSGKIFLDATQPADVGAANGQPGTWLLDPSNVTIQLAGGLLDILSPLFIAGVINSTISAAVLSLALNLGGNVVISTNHLLGGQTGNIVVNADAPITKTAAGITNLSLLSATDIQIDGAITATAGTLNVTLTANDGSQAGHDPDTTAGNIDINAAISTNGGTFSSTGVDFDNTGGTITTAGGSLTLNQDGLVTIGAQINAGDGAVDIDATGVGSTVDIDAPIIGGTGNVNIDAVGLTTISNTGSITTTTGNVSIGGALAGLLSLGGNITSVGGDITLNNAATLIDSVVINTGAGAGNLTVGSTVDGANPLTVNVGLGDITLQADVGSTVELTSVDLTAGNLIDLQADVLTTGAQTYNGPLQTAGTLASSVAGACIINGALTLAGTTIINTAGAITDDVTITGPVDGANLLTINVGLGDITLQADVGSTVELTSVDLTAGNLIDLQADVLTTGAQTYNGPLQTAGTLASSVAGACIINGALTLAGTTIINTAGAITDDVTITGTVDGANPLTVNVGLGDITLQADVGSTTELASVDMTAANLIDLQADVLTTGAQTYNGPIQTAGTLASSAAGAVNLNGLLTLAGATIINTAGAITDDVTITGPVDGANLLTINVGLGDITLQADVGSTVELASVDLTAANLIDLQADVTTTGIQIYNGPVSVGGVIATTNSDVTINGDMIIPESTAAVISTGPGEGDITVTGSTGGTAGIATELLTLDAGTGNVTLVDTVAGAAGAADATGLTSVTITDAEIVQLPAFVISGPLTTTNPLTGPLTAGGALQTGSLSLSGTDLNLNSGFISGGTTSLTSSGTTNLAGPGSSSTGVFSVTGATVLATDLTTTNAAVTFNSPITLGGNATIDTGAGLGDVTFVDTIDGANQLMINAGGGDIIIQADIGATTPLANLTATANTIDAQIDVATIGAQIYNGNISIGGTFTTNGSDLTVNGDMLIPEAQAAILITGPGEGDITVTGITSGTAGALAESVTFNAGTGDLTLGNTVSGAAGVADATGLTSVTITDAEIVQLPAFVVSGPLTTTNPLTGPLTAGGALQTGSLSLSGTDLNLNSGFVSDGTATLTSSGTLTVAGPGSSSTGAFTAIGATVLNSDLTTTNSPVTFNSPVTLGGGAIVSTGPGAGDVTFVDTIDGASQLTINAGGGDVDLQGNLGATTPLTSLSVTGNMIDAQVGVATTGAQTYTGDTTLGGTIASTTAGAVDLIGNVTLAATTAITTAGAATDDITITGAIDGANPLTINAGGGDIDLQSDLGATTPLTSLTATANTIDAQIDVATTGAQTYTGDTTLGGTIASTTAGAVNLIGNVTLAATTAITTAGAATDDITITGAIDGANPLTINAGGGDIALQSDLGTTTPLTSLAATGNTIDAEVDVATTGAQTYTGNTTLGGTLASTTAGAINLIGNVTLGGVTLINTAGAGTDDVTVTGTIDGANPLAINVGGGDIDLQSDAGSITPLTDFTITQANTATLNGLAVVDDISLTADELDFIGGAGSLTTSSVGTLLMQPTGSLVSIDVGSPAGGSGTLDLSDTDLAALGDGFGGVTIGRADGQHAITVGSVSVSDPLTLQSPSGGAITVNDLITGTGNASLTLQALIAVLNAGMLTSGQPITLNTTIILGQSVALDTTGGGGSPIGADIVFANPLNATTPGTEALSLDAGSGGDITFNDALGAVTKLGAITVTNAQDVTSAAGITASSFTQTAGTGDTLLQGALDTSGLADAAGGVVQITTAGAISALGLIDTSGGTASGGNAGQAGGGVTLTSTGGAAIVSGITTSGSAAAGGSNLAGGDAGGVLVQPASGLTLGGKGVDDVRPDGLITILGAITSLGGLGDGAGADGAGGDIQLAPTGRINEPSVATIIGNPNGGDITINTSGDITVGQNEKISALDTVTPSGLGSISLTSDGGTITIGDLSAKGDITVDAGPTGVIDLLVRPIGGVLLSNNTLMQDEGLDILADGLISLLSPITIGGVGGPTPLFASTDQANILPAILADPRFLVAELLTPLALRASAILDGFALAPLIIVGGGGDGGLPDIISGVIDSQRPRPQGPDGGGGGNGGGSEGILGILPDIFDNNLLNSVLDVFGVELADDQAGVALTTRSRSFRLAGEGFVHDDFAGAAAAATVPTQITINRLNSAAARRLNSRIRAFQTRRLIAYRTNLGREYKDIMGNRDAADGLNSLQRAVLLVDRISKERPQLYNDLEDVAGMIESIETMSCTDFEKQWLASSLVELTRSEDVGYEVMVESLKIIRPSSSALLNSLTLDEPRVASLKTDYLSNFLRFTRWPDNAFASTDSPLVITMVGQDRFASVFDASIQSRPIAARNVRVLRLQHPAAQDNAPQGAALNEAVAAFNQQLADSHVVYIGGSEAPRLGSILSGLAGADALTVSTIPGFVEQGGMLGMVQTGNDIRFDSNTDAIQRSQLKVSSKLLDLSRTIEAGQQRGNY